MGSDSKEMYREEEEERRSEKRSQTQRGRRNSGAAKTSSEEEEVEQIPLSIDVPRCIKPIFHSLIGQFLYEEDSFIQLMRKAFIFFLFCAGLTLPLFGVYWFWRFSKTNMLNDILAGCLITGSFPIHVLYYLQLRRKKHVSDTFLMVAVSHQMAWFTLSTLTAVGTQPRYGMNMLMLLISYAIGYKRIWIVNIWFFLDGFMDCWNRSFWNEEGAFLFHLPTERPGSIELLVFNLGWHFLLILPIGVLYATFSQQKTQVLMAQNSTAVAKEIVNLLRRYDTEKVREKVRESIENADKEKVNVGLMKSFDLMVDNLEKYRPFLPNYLFLSSNDDNSDRDDDEGTIKLMSDEETKNSSQRRKDRRRRKGSKRTRGSSCDGASSQGGASSQSSSHGGVHHQAPGSHSADEGSHDNSLSNSTTAATSVTAHHGNTPAPSSVTTSAGSNYFKGWISLALLELQSSSWFTRRPRGTDGTEVVSAQKALTLVVDAIFEVAKATKASVHSMLGDAVQLSWNATHRTAQPECKVTQFLVSARDLIREETGFAVSGSACSGLAEVHTAFSTKAKQLALVVDAHWQPALEALFELASAHRALLVDSNTKTAASYQVSAQAVDCIRYRPRAALAEKATDTEQLYSVKISPGAKAMPTLRAVALDGVTSERRSGNQSMVTALEFKRGDVVKAEAESDSLPCCYTLAFELTGRTRQEEDEWMYQLKAQEDAAVAKQSVEERVTSVTLLATEGRYGEAVEQAEKLKSDWQAATKCDPQRRSNSPSCNSFSPNVSGSHLEIDPSSSSQLRVDVMERQKVALNSSLVQRLFSACEKPLLDPSKPGKERTS